MEYSVSRQALRSSSTVKTSGPPGRRRPLLGLLQHDRDRQRFVEAERAVVARHVRRPDYAPLLMSYYCA